MGHDGENSDVAVEKANRIYATACEIPSDGPEPGSPTWKQRLMSSMDRFWLLEACCLFVSLSALVAIASMLMALADGPIPQWSTSGTLRIRDRFTRDYSLSVTVNSVLSLIATVFKITLGIPVAASLGQLKWDWFAKGRSLADFQMFDSAKGALGSLILLWNMRARRLACLAAIITLGSLALDFSFQSLVTYPITRTRTGSGTFATVPFATYYKNAVRPAFSGFAAPSDATVDQSMLGDIYTGIFNYNSSSFITPVCITGDCTWNNTLDAKITSPKEFKSFASLGVCGQCRDATSSLRKACGTHVAQTNTYDVNNSRVNATAPYCLYTLPNQLSLAGDGGLFLLNMSGEAVNNTRFQNIESPFSILSIIRGDWTNRLPNGTEVDESYDDDFGASYLRNASATECALYPCVRLYDAAVVNGTYRETVRDTFQKDTVSGDPITNPSNTSNYTLTIPKTWRMAAAAVRTFDVDTYAWNGVRSQFKNTWSGNVTAEFVTKLPHRQFSSSDVAQTIVRLNDTGLARTIDNLAQAMTNNIRMSSGQLAQGIAFQSSPYVVVIWGWLALPAGLLLIAIILLASTIYRTKRSGTLLWKTSSLAAFYHPLTDSGRHAVGDAQGNRHLEKIAEDVHVKWAKTDKGWRLIPVKKMA